MPSDTRVPWATASVPFAWRSRRSNRVRGSSPCGSTRVAPRLKTPLRSTTRRSCSPAHSPKRSTPARKNPPARASPGMAGPSCSARPTRSVPTTTGREGVRDRSSVPADTLCAGTPTRSSTGRSPPRSTNRSRRCSRSCPTARRPTSSRSPRAGSRSRSRRTESRSPSMAHRVSSSGSTPIIRRPRSPV